MMRGTNKLGCQTPVHHQFLFGHLLYQLDDLANTEPLHFQLRQHTFDIE